MGRLDAIEQKSLDMNEKEPQLAKALVDANSTANSDVSSVRDRSQAIRSVSIHVFFRVFCIYSDAICKIELKPGVFLTIPATSCACPPNFLELLGG